MTQPKRTTLAIQQIVADEQIQPRLSLNNEDVETYKQAIEGGAEMEPLIVFYDGKINWLSSGFTRRKAYEMANVTEIPVEVRQGTKRDAWLFAKSANKHGRRFTNEEKRRNVVEMLEDDECGQWSDNKIALHIGVSQPFVGEIRRSLITVISGDSSNGDQKADSPVRTGADGRSIKTANIGKKSKPKSSEKSAGAAGEEAETDGYGRPIIQGTTAAVSTVVMNDDLPEEAEEPEENEASKQLTKAEEDALSDSEWLDTLPLRAKLQTEKINTLHFDQAALNYRKLQKPLAALRREANALINDAMSDVFSKQVRAATTIPHPKKWQFSRGCVGGFLLW